MSEIRNLTRNGETFYPLTIADAVSDPNGEFFGYYEENPEWIRVILDNEKKVLAGIKSDGSIEWSLGVPKPVKDYILENLDTLYQQLDDSKVDKVEGKSLIDSEYAEGISYQENPEFIDAKLDNTGKVLEGIQKDGTKIFGSDVRVLGSLDINGTSYRVVENPEWAKVIVDSNGKIICGINTSGKFVVFSADFLDDIDSIKARLNEFKDIGFIENPEFISVELDANNKVLGGRKIDGIRLENAGIETPSFVLESTNDIEKRYGIMIDLENKIISFRKSNGVLVEESGIETTHLNADSIDISKEGISKLSKDLRLDEIGTYNSPNLPKYGTTNIKTETFYLTAVEGLNSISQTELIQDFEDTNANATDRMTICHYYFGNIRLRHYAAKRVKLNTTDNKYYAKETIRKIGNTWYYADTLGYDYNNTGNLRTKVIQGYTEIYNGAVPETGNYALIQTEVIKVTAPCNVNTWTIEDWDFNAVEGTDIGTKYEHYCTASVGFGYFLTKSNVYVGVKHQGNSTQGNRKRNYRYTFYKKSDYDKKDKIKFGEMVRLSKYNLKANWNDISRIKELVLYRLFTQTWSNRPIIDRFDWDNKVNGLYHGATGTSNGFPVELNVNGEFYGLYMFLLPKDEKLYMLDGEDESGLFVSGGSAGNTNPRGIGWGANVSYFSSGDVRGTFDEEMLDEMSDDTANALSIWFEFINSRLYKDNEGNEYIVKNLSFFDENSNIYSYSDIITVDGVAYVGSTLTFDETSSIYVPDDNSIKIKNVYVTSTLENNVPVESSVKVSIIKFDKENVSERLDVLGWIDYFIMFQTFLLTDNGRNNILFYSNSEKKKIFPFFYDLDGAIPTNYGAEVDVLDDSINVTTRDRSLWRHIRDLYWDEIVNRYCELRNTYLSTSYITSIYEDLSNNIPKEDYNNENLKWSVNTDSSRFEVLINFMNERLNWLDENYFII